MTTTSRNTNRLLQLMAAALVLAAAAGARAQTTPPVPSFNSGSSGDDGDFKPTANVNFDPSQINRVNGAGTGRIDPDQDNVFHFKNIEIPAGVTVTMSAKWTNGPIYFLASGDVLINGDLQLSGQIGVNDTQTTLARVPSIPGPGGFQGGLGARVDPTPADAPTAGRGPGGGRADGIDGWSAGLGEGGKITVNAYLVPLIGGSGGGGGDHSLVHEWWGAGGGAGGGAILISSSQTITLTGRIFANGGTGGRWRLNGNCTSGGAGAGGSIRLVARTLKGGGRLEVSNGGHGCNGWEMAAGQNGRVRFEAFEHLWTYAIPFGTYTNGTPIKSFVPTVPPSTVAVTHVAGTQLENPKGEFTSADITINSSGEILIKVAARGVPLTRRNPKTGLQEDTKVTVHLFSLDGHDQMLESTPLQLVQGSTTDSTATVTVPSFPPGFTKGYAAVKW